MRMSLFGAGRAALHRWRSTLIQWILFKLASGSNSHTSSSGSRATPSEEAQGTTEKAAAELRKWVHDDLMAEYARLADTVAAFDSRLLTMKSWGVTFSLATLALGFSQKHYGLFLTAAAGALAFWIAEATTKTHQMRFYPRMRDIELASYQLYAHRDDKGNVVSSPLIDWSWHKARSRIWKWDRTSPSNDNVSKPRPWKDDPSPSRSPLGVLLWPHVAMPHAIVVVLGAVLFAAGACGHLGSI